jgi:hypothetical protein
LSCAVCSFPALAKRGYDFLKEEKGFSDMSIIAGEPVVEKLLLWDMLRSCGVLHIVRKENTVLMCNATN